MKEAVKDIRQKKCALEQTITDALQEFTNSTELSVEKIVFDRFVTESTDGTVKMSYTAHVDVFL